MSSMTAPSRALRRPGPRGRGPLVVRPARRDQGNGRADRRRLHPGRDHRRPRLRHPPAPPPHRGRGLPDARRRGHLRGRRPGGAGRAGRLPLRPSRDPPPLVDRDRRPAALPALRPAASRRSSARSASRPRERTVPPADVLPPADAAEIVARHGNVTRRASTRRWSRRRVGASTAAPVAATRVGPRPPIRSTAPVGSRRGEVRSACLAGYDSSHRPR